jgi:hypothetical protein
LGWVTGVFGLVMLSTFALTVGHLGQGKTFRAALGSARATVLARPGRLFAAAGVLIIAAFLIFVLPVTAPLLVGYVLLALHTITR